MTSPYGALSDELEGLIERVSRATGADREIDRDLFAVFEPARALVAFNNGAVGVPVLRLPRNLGGLGGAAVLGAAPRYTGSIDAAVALSEGVTHRHGRKLICFFCAGGQLTSENAEPGSLDYHPLAKIDTSVTVGWLSHVAFFKDGGSETYGPERYSHGPTPSLAIISALLAALRSLQTGNAE